MVKNSLNQIIVEKISERAVNWVWTPQSIVKRTVLFLEIFSLKFLGVGIDQILLILTTAVSLEVIYLAIFIRMTVNINTSSLKMVEDDIIIDLEKVTVVK